MPTYGQEFVVPFLVRDRETGAGVAGDAANLAMYLVANGTMVPAANAPIEAVSYGGPPGWYCLQIEATEAQADCIVVCGTSSTDGAEVVPVTVTLERPADVWDIVDGSVAYGDRLLRVERRLLGTTAQRKSDGLTRIYADDGETVIAALRYAEDASYRYQSDEPSES